jgi:hypothetical protein
LKRVKKMKISVFHRKRSRVKKAIGWTSALCIVLLLVLQMSGCMKNLPTGEPIEELIYEPVHSSELTFICLGGTRSSALGEGCLYHEMEGSPNSCAMLKVWCEGEERSVTSTLFVPRHAVNETCTLSLALPEDVLLSEVGRVSGSHGTTFDVHARLGMMASGLDLCGIDPDKVGFYCYNEDLNLWERLEDLFLHVNVESGTIIAYCPIEYFSRYAIAER